MARLFAALGLGAAVFVFALLSHNHFPNDHFVYLSCAAQMLAGEWPTRDFADPGMPLMYVVSAAGQWLGGRTLMAEALLVYGALAAGAAVLAFAVGGLTGSTLLGLWAGASSAIIGPRTYSYPKILLYAAAVSLFVWGARTRSSRMPLILATLTSVAFLFRHDHGLFIGTAAAVFVLTVGEAPIRRRVRRLAWYAGLTILLIVPYLAYVHAHGGLTAYVRSAAEFSRQEARRTDLKSWTPSVRTEDPRASAAAALFYAFWAFPVVAAIIARKSKGQSAVATGAICMLAIAVNAGFLRDRLEERIADAIVPAATLAAFISVSLVRSQESRARRAVASVGVAIVLAGFSVAEGRVGRLPEQLARSELSGGPSAIAARWRQVTFELRNPRAAPQMPSAVALALMPFFEYTRECTRANDSIFVPGFAPEVSYFADRRFAGGHVTLPGEYYSSESEQRRTMSMLENQSVPLVVLPPGSRARLERFRPTLAKWLQRYTRVATYIDHQSRTTEVLVRDGLPSVRTHVPSGLPCFR